MKITIVCLCIFLSLFFASCKPSPQPNSGFDGTSAPPASTHSQSVPPTQPTTVSTDPSVPPTTTVPTELASFNALFGDWQSWYNRALTCQYESPKELNLLKFFYCGFKGETTKTAAEWEALKDLQGFNENYDFFRLPVDKMNEVLTAYFGITLSDVAPSGFDGLVYLESTNCYYFMATGANTPENFSALSVETAETGMITVRYTIQWTAPNEYIVTLKPVGDGFIILSNVAA